MEYEGRQQMMGGKETAEKSPLHGTVCGRVGSYFNLFNFWMIESGFKFFSCLLFFNNINCFGGEGGRGWVPKS